CTVHLSTVSSFFSFSRGVPLHLHSFPTRRSSDLSPSSTTWAGRSRRWRPSWGSGSGKWTTNATPWGSSSTRCRKALFSSIPTTRSEEHTSELQSREKLVCRLLLEKKKRMHLEVAN